MSLLSKLLGGKKPTLSEVVDLFQTKEQKPASQPARPANRPEPVYTVYMSDDAEETPIGRSWGERMPNEPNQYNYPGSYLQYFEDIFNRDFAAYRVNRSSNPRTNNTTVYSFYDGARLTLVVEIMSRRGDLQQLRLDCARSRTPYLRFYYDYYSWWNARSYVVNRIRKALGA